MRIIRPVAVLFSIVLMLFFYHEAADPSFLNAVPEAQEAMLHKDGAPDVLRLHVLANSDSAEDQRVKLLVRDALVKEFAPAESLEEAEEVLLNGGGGVLETVNRVLREQSCAYGAQLRLGVMDFPEKQYGGTIYPAGKYEALRVELGNAQGQNWWCVLFPPLCLVDIGVEDIPGTDELVFESDIVRLIEQWRKEKP
ncbi:MAG TPA: stage II sporulation protein R [Feifaniaceae bacterium]|nr:stage II sporulation protein R [Feifaniaceae bacterium]